MRVCTSALALFAGAEAAGLFVLGSSFGLTFVTGTIWGEILGGWSFRLRAPRLSVEGYYRTTVNRGVEASMQDGGARSLLGYEF